MPTPDLDWHQDEVLADAVIARLNALIHDPAVRDDIELLIEQRVTCSEETLTHPSLQAVPLDRDRHITKGEVRPGWLGVLGLLNGIVGVIPDGPRKGWGFITAVYEDNGDLARFERTST